MRANLYNSYDQSFTVVAEVDRSPDGRLQLAGIALTNGDNQPSGALISICPAETNELPSDMSPEAIATEIGNLSTSGGIYSELTVVGASPQGNAASTIKPPMWSHRRAAQGRAT